MSGISPKCQNDTGHFKYSGSRVILDLVMREQKYEADLPRLSGGSAYDVICGSREALVTAFKKKTGLLLKYESEEMKQGKLDEELVLNMFSVLYKKKLVPGPRNHLSDIEYPDRFTACIDAYCADEDAGVEVKTCQTTSICYLTNPKHYAQVQFYMQIADLEYFYYVQYKPQGYDPQDSSHMLNVRMIQRDRGWWKRNLPKFIKYTDYLVEFKRRFPDYYNPAKKIEIDLFIDDMCNDILNTHDG